MYKTNLIPFKTVPTDETCNNAVEENKISILEFNVLTTRVIIATYKTIIYSEVESLQKKGSGSFHATFTSAHTSPNSHITQSQRH